MNAHGHSPEPTLGIPEPKLSALTPGQNITSDRFHTRSGLSALRDEIETAYDLLTALDKTGDGIGGDVGHGVSAVALAARAALDNARSMVKAMEAAR